jgi:hypothetical protein
MALVSEHRVLPVRTLNLFLYPLGAWGLALLGLYASGYAVYAIPLCYVVGLWQAGLTAWWGRGIWQRFDAEEISREEANAGVRSVGQLLAASALTPAIVFLTNDPLAPTAWSTTIGVLAVAGLAYLGVTALVRMRNRWAYTAALTLACLALPVNATGAVTVASMVGLYDFAREHTPTPDLLVPDKD